MKHRILGLLVGSLSVFSTEGEQGFVQSHCSRAAKFGTRNEVLFCALNAVSFDGLYIELGVWKGETIRYISRQLPRSKTVYGFDSFEGLPETWNKGDEECLQGQFAIEGKEVLPRVPRNVTLFKGWFSDTLPVFVQSLPPDAKISFLHVDCDLYSSTASALRILAPLIQEGTIISFDEFYNYPNCREHEMRALSEFLEENSLTVEYLAYNARGQQVAVRIRNIDKD